MLTHHLGEVVRIKDRESPFCGKYGIIRGVRRGYWLDGFLHDFTLAYKIQIGKRKEYFAEQEIKGVK